MPSWRISMCPVLRIAATARTQQADVQIICLNRSELKPQAHEEAINLDR